MLLLAGALVAVLGRVLPFLLGRWSPAWLWFYALLLWESRRDAVAAGAHVFQSRGRPGVTAHPP